jgi:hypothetical protein
MADTIDDLREIVRNHIEKYDRQSNDLIGRNKRSIGNIIYSVDLYLVYVFGSRIPKGVAQTITLDLVDEIYHPLVPEDQKSCVDDLWDIVRTEMKRMNDDPGKKIQSRTYRDFYIDDATDSINSYLCWLFGDRLPRGFATKITCEILDELSHNDSRK